MYNLETSLGILGVLLFSVVSPLEIIIQSLYVFSFLLWGYYDVFYTSMLTALMFCNLNLMYPLAYVQSIIFVVPSWFAFFIWVILFSLFTNDYGTVY